MNEPGFPEDFFDRQDASDDAGFYRMPRMVAHIDDATIRAVTDAYRKLLPAGGAVLDLMSSWISHLPDDVEFERVAGLGMNAQELEANRRLTDHVVHDLNRELLSGVTSSSSRSCTAEEPSPVRMAACTAAPCHTAASRPRQSAPSGTWTATAVPTWCEATSNARAATPTPNASTTLQPALIRCGS